MKRLLLICLTLVIMIGLLQPATIFAREANSTSPNLSRSIILMDKDTGKVLEEEKSDIQLPPASMTKMMTMLLILEAIDKKQLKWDEKITTSAHAASMGGSQIFLEEGEKMTVKNMMKGIAIGSANDASMALAEHIAGSEDRFVEKMNQKVKELSLKNTHFKNPTGLPEKGHYSSAYDMAQIARELLNYEEITKFTGKYEAYLREETDRKFWLVNTNKLVKFYPGVDGLKTGFTQEAKYCLTATAKKGNMRLIAVVFGSPTSKDRNAQVSKILNEGFSQYHSLQLSKKGVAKGDVKVQRGSQSIVSAVTSRPLTYVMKKEETPGHLTMKTKLNTLVKAPVLKGAKVGTLSIWKNKIKVGEVPLIASRSVGNATYLDLLKRTLADHMGLDKTSIEKR
jgi:D-alanyl-D-alanine carboxypeptidase (penicillin-binding protein 5/6)